MFARLTAIRARTLPLAALLLGGLLMAGGALAAPDAPKPSRAKAPRFVLLGSAPVDGGKLVGNSIAMLFGDLPAEVGTPAATAYDETTKRAVPARSALHCRGEHNAGRRCVVTVVLPGAEVGHRYRVEVLEQRVTVTVASGHPGERRR